MYGLCRLHLTLSPLIGFRATSSGEGLVGTRGNGHPVDQPASECTQLDAGEPIPFFKFSYSCVCDMRDSSLACYYVVSLLRS